MKPFKGKVYGVPVFIYSCSHYESEIHGRNWFWDICLRVVCFIAVYVLLAVIFPIKIEKE